jgi:hypothetical protein
VTRNAAPPSLGIVACVLTGLRGIEHYVELAIAVPAAESFGQRTVASGTSQRVDSEARALEVHAMRAASGIGKQASVARRRRSLGAVSVTRSAREHALRLSMATAAVGCPLRTTAHALRPHRRAFMTASAHIGMIGACDRAEVIARCEHAVPVCRARIQDAWSVQRTLAQRRASAHPRAQSRGFIGRQQLPVVLTFQRAHELCTWPACVSGSAVRVLRRARDRLHIAPDAEPARARVLSSVTTAAARLQEALHVAIVDRRQAGLFARLPAAKSSKAACEGEAELEHGASLPEDVAALAQTRFGHVVLLGSVTADARRARRERSLSVRA